MTTWMADAAMILGWTGAALSMLAYWSVSSGRVMAASLRYHALNMFACLLLAIACLASRSWPSMVTNLLFIAIGVRMTWQLRERLAARIRFTLAHARPRRRRAVELQPVA